MIKLLEDN